MTVVESGTRDSSVGMATRYGLEGPGIESRWGEIFCTYPDWLRCPPSLLYDGYRVFPGGKGGRGVMLTTHPFLVPRLRKGWAIPPLTLWVLLGLLRGSLPRCVAQTDGQTEGQMDRWLDGWMDGRVLYIRRSFWISEERKNTVLLHMYCDE
jgi:hypothetical protein